MPKDLKRFDPGKLKRRIQIERDTVTSSSGVESKTPLLYTTTWAAAEIEGGREQLEDSNVASATFWKFTLRYRSDLLPRDRVVYLGERMEIRAILPDEDRRDYIILRCESRGKSADAGDLSGPARNWDDIPGNFDAVPGNIDDVR